MQPLSHSATQPLSHSATQPLSHSQAFKLKSEKSKSNVVGKIIAGISVAGASLLDVVGGIIWYISRQKNQSVPPATIVDEVPKNELRLDEVEIEFVAKLDSLCEAIGNTILEIERDIPCEKYYKKQYFITFLSMKIVVFTEKDVFVNDCKKELQSSGFHYSGREVVDIQEIIKCLKKVIVLVTDYKAKVHSFCLNERQKRPVFKLDLSSQWLACSLKQHYMSYFLSKEFKQELNI